MPQELGTLSPNPTLNPTPSLNPRPTPSPTFSPTLNPKTLLCAKPLTNRQTSTHNNRASNDQLHLGSGRRAVSTYVMKEVMNKTIIFTRLHRAEIEPRASIENRKSNENHTRSRTPAIISGSASTVVGNDFNLIELDLIDSRSVQLHDASAKMSDAT